MTVKEISQKLSAQALSVAEYLLPNGKHAGREYQVGSVAGEQGDSCKICVAGSKAGVWSDFATGDSGDMLDLWAATRGIALFEAIAEAKKWLGIEDDTAFLGKKRKDYKKPKKPPARKVQSDVETYLKGRGLTDKSINAYQIGQLETLGSKKGPWIVFPFKRGEDLVFLKYLHLNRDSDGKKVVQAEAGCEPCLMGWPVVPPRNKFVAITEGEIDAMSVFECEIPALSVPFGAGTGAKNSWIENDWDRLEQFTEIFLCFDQDEAGQIAVKDVAQRLGLHRCKIVNLPCKDANETLQSKGKKELVQCFVDAETIDPEELQRSGKYTSGVIERFYPTSGKRPGFDFPWQKIPIRSYLGEVSVWTGWNGHGKSILLGQLVTEAARQGQIACIASFEMHPEKTLERMVQQFVGNFPNKDQIIDAMNWYNSRVWIFDLVGTAKKDRLLDVFSYAYHRYGITQFVIDSLSKCGIADDDYDGQKSFIDALGDFVKQTNTHVHLVAHSRKGSDESRPPGKMDIKGSGSLTDMVDNVFCVFKNKQKRIDLQNFKEGIPVKGKTREEVEKEYDATLLCEKSREDGSDVEGMYGLFFDFRSKNFVEDMP